MLCALDQFEFIINPKFGDTPELGIDMEKDFKKQLEKWTKNVQESLNEPWKNDKTGAQLIHQRVKDLFE